MHATAPNVAINVVEPGSTQDSWAKRLRRRAKELTGELDTGYMEMARILYSVYDRPVGNGIPLYMAWGYKSFDEYAEEELGMAKRKAEYLRRIYYRLEVELKLPPELKQRAYALGWTKARTLVRVLTDNTAAEWIEKAEKSTVKSLESACKAYLEEAEKAQKAAVEAGKDPSDCLMEVPVPVMETFHPRTFTLTTEQLEIVEAAIVRAGQVADSDKRGHLLHLICLDFLASNYLGKADKDIQAKYLARFEELLGLKMILVDDGDVVYGIDTLESLAKSED